GCPAHSSRPCSASGRGPSSARTGGTRRSFRSRSDSGSTARRASRSAIGGPTCRAAWTTSPSCGRCTRPTTTPPPRSRCTPPATAPAAGYKTPPGRHKLDERQPVLGSWIHYGLGTLNEDLPQFVFLGQYSDPRVRENFSADYLGPQYAGVELSLDPGNPLPFGARSPGVTIEEQANEFALIRDLNRLSA